MQRQMNDPTVVGTAGVSQVGRRRGGRPVSGGGQFRRRLPRIGRRCQARTLALNGGPKAVTAPTGNATRWPLYGEEEEKEVAALAAQPQLRPDRNVREGVGGIPQGRVLQGPLQRHQRADLDVVCPGSAARKRDPGARPQHLVPRGADAVVRAGSGLRRRQPANAQHRRRGLQTAADEEHAGDHAGPLVRPALRHGSHLRLRQGARAGGGGRRQPRAWRVAARPAHGHLGPHVGLQPARQPSRCRPSKAASPCTRTAWITSGP